MKEKVLFVLNSFSGGGAERVCHYLASELSREMEVDIVTIYDESDYLVPEGASHISLGVRKNADKQSKLWQLVKSRSKFNAFVYEREKSGRYALITAHLTASHVLIATSCLKDRCLYVHHSLPSSVMKQFSGISGFFLRRLYKRKKMVSVSEGVRKQLVKSYNIHLSDVTTIYNPVPLDAIEKGIDGKVSFERPYLLCVGRLVPSKRFDRMLQVYLKGMFSKDYDLVFLGQGPLKEEIEKTVNEYGIGEYVHLLGFKENPYLWMHCSSAMVMTSDWEALPTVLVEGVLAGARVVSADCDFGPREILTGEYSRFLVRPDDIDGYVSVINDALQSYPQMKKNFVKRYDPQFVAHQYLECYREAFAGRWRSDYEK